MSIKFIAIAAVTLDGKIAKHKSHMSDWTSKEDKAFLHAMLDKCDVILVGNNTYKTAIKPLSKRNCIVLTRAIPLSPYEGRAGEGLQYCNPQKSDLKKIIANKKYKTIAILGGAQTYAYCLQNGMLNELYLTIEPVVFGEGINLFSPFSPSPYEGRAGEGLYNHRFKLVSIKKLNKQGTALLRYKVK